MEQESVVFNEKYRSETPDRVYVILDIASEKINIGVLNMIYEQIVDTQLKTTIFYNSKAYNMTDLLTILQAKDVASGVKNFCDDLKYIQKEFICNEGVRIDNYLNVIIFSDKVIVDNDGCSQIIKEFESSFKSRDKDTTYTKNIDITTILYDIEVKDELLNSYTQIFEDHEVYKIDALEPDELKQRKLKGTYDHIYENIHDIRKLKVASKLELTFMNSDDTSMMCDVYELGSHSLLAGQISYKTKLYESGNPQKGEVFNKRYNINPITNQRLDDKDVKSCYQLADDSFITTEEADKIFQNYVCIGEKKTIKDNETFLYALGFVSLESYYQVATLINISKALELRSTDDIKNGAVFSDFKSELYDSGKVMLCLGRALASKEIRNYVVVAQKIGHIEASDDIKLFMLELPFKDEIRMFPKCAANEDYKTSTIEKEYYNDFKSIFENIFVGDKNIKISSDEFKKMVAEYNYKDVNTKNYENLFRKKAFVSVDEDPVGVDELDDTYGLIEQRNEYLYAGYTDELDIMHRINKAFYKQHQHLENAKKRVSKPRTTNGVKRAKK
ncbi:unnamed protein product [Hanseniaspora opuntiae]